MCVGQTGARRAGREVSPWRHDGTGGLRGHISCAGGQARTGASPAPWCPTCVHRCIGPPPHGGAHMRTGTSEECSVFCDPWLLWQHLRNRYPVRDLACAIQAVMCNRNAHGFFTILAGVSLRLSTLGWRQHCRFATFRIPMSLFVRSGARKKRGVGSEYCNWYFREQRAVSRSLIPSGFRERPLPDLLKVY
jgi:hypothetical protein